MKKIDFSIIFCGIDNFVVIVFGLKISIWLVKYFVGVKFCEELFIYNFNYFFVLYKIKLV